MNGLMLRITSVRLSPPNFLGESVSVSSPEKVYRICNFYGFSLSSVRRHQTRITGRSEGMILLNASRSNVHGILKRGLLLSTIDILQGTRVTLG